MLDIEMGDKHIISRVIDELFKNPRLQARAYNKNQSKKQGHCDECRWLFIII
jgi:hypothetical protein